MSDFDDYLLNKSNNTKPVRDFVDLSCYTITDGKVLINDRGETCNWNEILEIFRVYQVKSCFCPRDVAELIIDIWPEIFNNIELELR